LLWGWKGQAADSISEIAFVTQFMHLAAAIPASQAGCPGFAPARFYKGCFAQTL